MNAIDCFPAPVCAAISGYCMGGGLDLALACRYRIASSHAVFRASGRGLRPDHWLGRHTAPAATGRKGRALEMLVAAEKITATRALQIGLIDAIAADPVAEAVQCLAQQTPQSPL